MGIKKDPVPFIEKIKIFFFGGGGDCILFVSCGLSLCVCAGTVRILRLSAVDELSSHLRFLIIIFPHLVISFRKLPNSART